VSRFGTSPVGGEADIVATFAPLAVRFPGAFGLSDDCALYAPEPGHEIVLTTDAVAAGVHFLDDDDPSDIGWKALAVNVSDLVAKGARPRIYLMSLALPEAPERPWLLSFVAGLAEAQAAFGIVLAGGDTDRRAGPLAITITALGEVPAGTMVRRGAAQPGDRLYVSGTLGDAALGLRLARTASLATGLGLTAGEVAHLVARYRRPQPRTGLVPVLRAHARAAMDISDGLVKDLGRMAAASGCGARVAIDRLPMSPAFRAAVDRDRRLMRDAMISGGDDYEILAAVAPERCRAFEDEAARTGVGVTAVGTIGDGSGVTVHDGDGRAISIPRDGWDHF
jgi:thiamine-monophosphate kinase